MKPTRYRQITHPTPPVKSRITLKIISGLMLPTEKSDLLDGYVIVNVYGPKDKDSAPAKLGRGMSVSSAAPVAAKKKGGLLDSVAGAADMQKSLVWSER